MPIRPGPRAAKAAGEDGHLLFDDDFHLLIGHAAGAAGRLADAWVHGSFFPGDAQVFRDFPQAGASLGRDEGAGVGRDFAASRPTHVVRWQQEIDADRKSVV